MSVCIELFSAPVFIRYKYGLLWYFLVNFSTPSRQSRITSTSLLDSQGVNEASSSVPLGQHIVQGLEPWSDTHQIASSSHDPGSFLKTSVYSEIGPTTEPENVGSYINQGVQLSSIPPTTSLLAAHSRSELPSGSNVSASSPKASTSSRLTVSSIITSMTRKHDITFQKSSLMRSASGVLPFKDGDALLTGGNNINDTLSRDNLTISATKTLTTSEDTNSRKNESHLSNALKCWSENNRYTDSRYATTCNATTAQAVTYTDGTTYPVTIYDTYRLCDGWPRAIIPQSQTPYFSTNPIFWTKSGASYTTTQSDPDPDVELVGVTGIVNYTSTVTYDGTVLWETSSQCHSLYSSLLAPNCTIEQEACTSLWSIWDHPKITGTRPTNYWAPPCTTTPVRTTYTGTDNCDLCFLRIGPIRLIYFPVTMTGDFCSNCKLVFPVIDLEADQDRFHRHAHQQCRVNSHHPWNSVYYRYCIHILPCVLCIWGWRPRRALRPVNPCWNSCAAFVADFEVMPPL